ncbi:translation initiation factor IF-2-like isoform X1 [Canis lupus familiaris]|uniref:translation initiation factor IF-2-like isoform X1 n=1 Tax=Canis lupus familiaris TaxID=9615 RepID=UPI0018F7D38F|nr:translation initiation factor IF-2-like isoform X1 [Canis lupus familiaris]
MSESFDLGKVSLTRQETGGESARARPGKAERRRCVCARCSGPHRGGRPRARAPCREARPRTRGGGRALPRRPPVPARSAGSRAPAPAQPGQQRRLPGTWRQLGRDAAGTLAAGLRHQHARPPFQNPVPPAWPGRRPGRPLRRRPAAPAPAPPPPARRAPLGNRPAGSPKRKATAEPKRSQGRLRGRSLEARLPQAQGAREAAAGASRLPAGLSPGRRPRRAPRRGWGALAAAGTQRGRAGGLAPAHPGAAPAPGRALRARGGTWRSGGPWGRGRGAGGAGPEPGAAGADAAGARAVRAERPAAAHGGLDPRLVPPLVGRGPPFCLGCSKGFFHFPLPSIQTAGTWRAQGPRPPRAFPAGPQQAGSWAGTRAFPVGSRGGGAGLRRAATGCDAFFPERARPLASERGEGPGGPRRAREEPGAGRESSGLQSRRPREPRGHPTKDTAGRPSADLPTPPRAARPTFASGLLRRRVSASPARWPRLPAGPPSPAPSPSRGTGEQPSAPARPGGARRGPAAGVRFIDRRFTATHSNGGGGPGGRVGAAGCGSALPSLPAAGRAGGHGARRVGGWQAGPERRPRLGGPPTPEAAQAGALRPSASPPRSRAPAGRATRAPFSVRRGLPPGGAAEPGAAAGGVRVSLPCPASPTLGPPPPSAGAVIRARRSSWEHRDGAQSPSPQAPPAQSAQQGGFQVPKPPGQRPGAQRIGQTTSYRY